MLCQHWQNLMRHSNPWHSFIFAAVNPAPTVLGRSRINSKMDTREFATRENA